MSLPDALAKLPPAVAHVTQECIWKIDSAIIEEGIPPEYIGAELKPSLQAVLREKPAAIYLHGAPGTGKTHQAWAMLRYDRLKRMRSLIEDGEAIDIMDRGNRGQWRDTHRARMQSRDKVKIITESGDIRRHRYDREWLDTVATFDGWLIVDDIGFAAANEWITEAIYHLSNERRAWKRPTVWTSNLSATELVDRFSQAIASRLAGGRVVTIGGDDRRLVDA